MPARRPSNPLALAVLTLLFERPMHPYEISSTLRERQKQESIKLNFGSLYSVVEALEKRGLIEVAETIREGNRPERTVYRITDDGRVTMVEWLRELLGNPVKEFPQFEAALSLMPALPADEVIQLLEQRLTRLQAGYTSASDLMARAADAGMPRIFGVEHEYELALQRAELEYVSGLLDDMRAGAFSGLAGWRRADELRAAGMSTEEIEATLRKEFEQDYLWLEKLDDLT